MQTPGPAGADQLSEQEQTLLSEIQDLQRQLWELKAAEASNVAGEGEAEQPDLESIMGKDIDGDGFIGNKPVKQPSTGAGASLDV